jgi:hypothetical protein
MIYVLKIIWDYRVSLLELIIRNIARYPQSATSTSIRYQPAIRYLLPWSQWTLRSIVVAWLATVAKAVDTFGTSFFWLSFTGFTTGHQCHVVSHWIQIRLKFNQIYFPQTILFWKYLWSCCWLSQLHDEWLVAKTIFKLLTPKFGSILRLQISRFIGESQNVREIGWLRHYWNRLHFMTASSWEWALPVENGGY